MIQGSQEWIEARLGRLGGSQIGAAVKRLSRGNGKGERSAEAKRVMVELITERLTGKPIERVITRDMQWGTDNEPGARNAYSFLRNVDVEQVGYVEHPTIKMAGVSPDGLVGADGLIEIKCPSLVVHGETVMGGDIDPAYMAQMQWGLACTGRKWCDYISYDPRWPEHLQLHIRRVARLEDMIAELEAGARDFLSEVDAKTILLEAKAHEAAA